jgi:multidrug efflux pump subunit AcrB
VNFVERSNRTVGTAIRSYVDTHDNWDAEIPKIQHAINTARHEITGVSPTFLNFARHVPLSGNYYGNVEPNGENIEIMPGDRDGYAAEITNLTAVFAAVRQKLHTAHMRY